MMIHFEFLILMFCMATEPIIVLPPVAATLSFTRYKLNFMTRQRLGNSVAEVGNVWLVLPQSTSHDSSTSINTQENGTFWVVYLQNEQKLVDGKNDLENSCAKTNTRRFYVWVCQTAERRRCR